MTQTPTEILWNALGRPEMPQMKKYAQEDDCCLCGVHRGTIRAQDTISSGFTNVDILRYQESVAVCLYCYSAMKSLYRGDVYGLWEQLGSPTPDIPENKLAGEVDTCAYCGKRDGQIKKSAVRPVGFTGTAREENPDSLTACLPCFVCSNYGIRQCSWLAMPSGIILLKRENIADAIFGDRPTETPFLFYVTTSQKKLGQLKVVTNHNLENYTLLFEEVQVQVDPEKNRELWDKLCVMYSYPAEEKDKKQPKTFFTKEEMRTGNYQLHRIKAFGIKEWKAYESLIRKYRGSALLSLFLYILNAEYRGRGNENGSRKRSSRREPDLSGVARDSVGQYEWFT